MSIKVGMDIHGVVDTYPSFFRKLSFALLESGNEVHILTGHQKIGALEELKTLDFPFTEIFSIVDYHFEEGTPMKRSENGNWWMEDKLWNSAKGDYAERVKLDFHFDDQLEYLNYFPAGCHTMLVKSDFDKVMYMVLDILSPKWETML